LVEYLKNINNEIVKINNLTYDENIDYTNKPIDGTLQINNIQYKNSLPNNKQFLMQKENVTSYLEATKLDLYDFINQKYPYALLSFILTGKSFKFQLAFTYNEGEK
jgi:hypothetical protein